MFSYDAENRQDNVITTNAHIFSYNEMALTNFFHHKARSKLLYENDITDTLCRNIKHFSSHVILI